MYIHGWLRNDWLTHPLCMRTCAITTQLIATATIHTSKYAFTAHLRIHEERGYGNFND